jgi:hypothetical protein
MTTRGVSPANLLYAGRRACVRDLQVETRAVGYMHRNQPIEMIPPLPCGVPLALARADRVGPTQQPAICKETHTPMIADIALSHLHRPTIIPFQIMADGQPGQYDPVGGAKRAEP